MVARFVLWSVAESATTLDELRSLELPRTPGALYESWFSDDTTDRFGTFAVFHDADAAGEPLPELLHDLIAKDPDVFDLFDLESHT